MKFEFPSLNYLFKSLIISLAIGSIAYFIFPQLTLEKMDVQRVFVYGLMMGSVLTALFVGSRITFPALLQNESIFVGNLAFKASSHALRQLFEQYGDVQAVRLMTDRVTRRPRGFGFVEMTRKDALAAIKALDGAEFYGREIKVNIANERRPRNQHTS